MAQYDTSGQTCTPTHTDTPACYWWTDMMLLPLAALLRQLTRTCHVTRPTCILHTPVLRYVLRTLLDYVAFYLTQTVFHST